MEGKKMSVENHFNLKVLQTESFDLWEVLKGSVSMMWEPSLAVQRNLPEEFAHEP